MTFLKNVLILNFSLKSKGKEAAIMKTTLRRNQISQRKTVRKSPPGEVERGCSME